MYKEEKRFRRQTPHRFRQSTRRHSIALATSEVSDYCSLLQAQRSSFPCFAEGRHAVIYSSSQVQAGATQPEAGLPNHQGDQGEVERQISCTRVELQRIRSRACHAESEPTRDDSQANLS